MNRNRSFFLGGLILDTWCGVLGREMSRLLTLKLLEYYTLLYRTENFGKYGIHRKGQIIEIRPF